MTQTITDPTTPPQAPARRGARRIASLLLVLQGLLVVNPVFAVSALFTNAGGLGRWLTSPERADGVIAQYFALLLPAVLALLALLAAWGLWHGARGVGALILQPLMLVVAVLPLTQSMTLASAVPAGNWALAALTVATAVVLVVVLGDRAGREAQTWWRRRWWVLVAYGTSFVLIAAVGLTGSSLPPDPTALLVPNTVGSAPELTVSDTTMNVPQNPALAANPHNSIHHDAWGTDAYELAGPRNPLTAPVESLYTGGDCGTITFDSRGRIVTSCPTISSAELYLIDPDTLEILASANAGDRVPSFTDFSGGGYIFLDNEDRVVFPAQGGLIKQFDLGGDEPEITQVGAIDVAGVLQDGENVQAVMPDWEGRYWFIGARGTVGVVNPDGSQMQTMRLDGEEIENSLAVAEDGAYIVTSGGMYKFAADEANAISVVWRAEYDAGSRLKPGQTSRASGTTPTVFADGTLVAIGDNAEPQMNVLVFRTTDGQRTCEMPVFEPGRSGTENALIAAGSTIVVENNYGYAPAPSVVTGGHTTTPGMAAVAVDPADGSCEKAWETDEISVPSVVSKASIATGQIFTYTKPRSVLGVDAWYFTAVDLETGEVQWKRLAGTGMSRNNHYAGTYLSPDGDLFTGNLRGMSVLRND